MLTKTQAMILHSYFFALFMGKTAVIACPTEERARRTFEEAKELLSSVLIKPTATNDNTMSFSTKNGGEFAINYPKGNWRPGNTQLGRDRGYWYMKMLYGEKEDGNPLSGTSQDV